MKRIRKWLHEVPHLFGKIMVIWCVVCGTVFSAWAFFILANTGQDASGLLVPVFAFFGGELALMFGKNALSSKRKDDEP